MLFALAALVVDGDEPVSLRYFHLRPDGSIAYLTQADIDAAAHHPAAKRELFQNAELRFRAAGSPAGEVRILRHVAFNLDDAHLKADPSLLAYLNAKGKVAAMTKAATHLLWNPHFALIRGYLIDHTDWMISDSTGLPPRIAGPAGYTQDTYGRFDGPSEFGDPDRKDAEDVRKLFASQPTRELSFRYGYPDRAGHAHLIVTHRGPGAGQSGGESGGSRLDGAAQPAGSGAPKPGSPGSVPAKPGTNPSLSPGAGTFLQGNSAPEDPARATGSAHFPKDSGCLTSPSTGRARAGTSQKRLAKTTVMVNVCASGGKRRTPLPVVPLQERPYGATQASRPASQLFATP